jgi:hypothetical protein
MGISLGNLEGKERFHSCNFVSLDKIANGLRVLARPMSPWMKHYANKAHTENWLNYT